MGLEPTTTGITIRYSNQLSYAHHCKSTGASSLFILKRSPFGIPASPSTLGFRPTEHAHHKAKLNLDLKAGTPDRTRTCNRRLRRPMLYPVELRAQLFEIIAPTGAARAVPSSPQAGNGICAPAKVVGVEGFELSTSSSQSWRSTRLSYTPPPISIALLRCSQKRSTTRPISTSADGASTAAIDPLVPAKPASSNK